MLIRNLIMSIIELINFVIRCSHAFQLLNLTMFQSSQLPEAQLTDSNLVESEVKIFE